MTDMTDQIDASCDYANLPIKVRSQYLSIIYAYYVPSCYSPASQSGGPSYIPGKSMWVMCWKNSIGMQSTSSFPLQYHFTDVLY